LCVVSDAETFLACGLPHECRVTFKEISVAPVSTATTPLSNANSPLSHP